MHKQTIEYVDFDGMERKEDFYFHLSLVEVTRLEAQFGRSISEQAEYVTKEGTLVQILDFLETVVLTSLGKKSLDGKSFKKPKEFREEFENSQAYAELFEKLLTDKEAAQKFGNEVADTGKNRKNVVSPKLVE